MITPILWYTLYKLAEFTSFEKDTRLSTVRLAELLGTSQQTASRHLSELEKRGIIMKQASFRGVEVGITKKGLEELRRIYIGLKNVLSGIPRKIILKGTVFSGFGEGRYYLGQKGYNFQFTRKLGFSPYPGTLNLKLSSSELRKKQELEMYPSLTIEGFMEDKRSFGTVRCYPAIINNAVKGAIIIIKRTHYDESVLEVIAPVYLRKRFNLKEGSEVKIEVPIKPSPNLQ
jgi:riboflavin kinase